VERDVDVFIDRSGNEKSTMLAVVAGEVGASAAKTDSQG
jgi:hypothetical protein